MVKVSGKRQYQRVGGTSLGGGTLWGLLSLLTGVNTFDEMLSMAERGDNAAVDMLVGDIYGTDYGKIGLKSTTIASSFGKVFNMKRQGETYAEHFGMSDTESTQADPKPIARRDFKPEDISRSLLLAVRFVHLVFWSFQADNAPATISDRSPTFSRRSTNSKTYILAGLSSVDTNRR